MAFMLVKPYFRYSIETQFQNIEHELNRIDVDADAAINFFTRSRFYENSRCKL